MPTQQEQFDTAFKTLTPEERTTYTKANPIINTGELRRFAPETGGYLTIDPSTLKSQERPLVVPPKDSPTTSAGIAGLADSTIASIEKTTADRTAMAKTAADTSKDELTTAMKQILDVQQNRETVESDLNIPELAKLSNETYTSLQASRRAQDKEIKAMIESNGGTTAGVNASIAAINRRYAFEQADLAIAYDVANRNYSAAQATADRKIQLELEPLQTKFEFQKTFYEQNREDLTKEQDKQFQLLLNKGERELDEQKLKLKTLTDTKLSLLASASEQGAPLDVTKKIQNAQTPEDAIMAAGVYAGDIAEREYKKAQTAKLYAEAADKKASNGAISRVSQVDPNSPTYIQDMIAASSGGATLTGDQTKPISKALTVVGQIDSLQSSLENVDTGPIIGILKSANPYDVQAQLIKAQLQALIPNLARGVYGEVGVLTDNDIANYRKTIGNLKSPKELNDLLLAMTLRTVSKGIDDQLEVAASAGRDVSGFANMHKRLQDKIDGLNVRLGVSEAPKVVDPSQADEDYLNSLNDLN